MHRNFSKYIILIQGAVIVACKLSLNQNKLHVIKRRNKAYVELDENERRKKKE